MIAMEMTPDFKKLLALEIEKVSSVTPITPFILGEPGIGKSSIIKAMCKEHGWHYFEVLCNQLSDRADLTGCRTVKTTETINETAEEIWKQVFFPHQDIQDAISCAKNNPNDIIVLFLDEINRTGSDITSAVLSFTTARKIGTFIFPDNVRFIVAGNDKGNISSLDSASISRFVKIALVPNAQTYMEYEKSVGTLNPYIEQVLTANPSYIFCKSSSVSSTVTNADGEDEEQEYEVFDEAEGFDQITTPRTISGLNAFLNNCTPDMLNYYVGQVSRDAETGEDVTMLQTIIAGHTGDTYFTQSICAAIVTDLTKGIFQKANTITPPTKPAVYNDIMRCGDRQTRDVMIQNLSDELKSAVLLYAVWEKGVDNSDLIATVARNYSGQFLTGDCQPQFSNLKSHDELDADNYAALINSQTTLGTMIRNILGD